MDNCGIDDGEDLALNMEKKTLETKYWGEVIGDWVQLRQNTGDVGEADENMAKLD